MACSSQIGTNIGGIPEVIIDGEISLFVVLGGDKYIVDKAIYILTNDNIHAFSDRTAEVAMKIRAGHLGQS